MRERDRARSIEDDEHECACNSFLEEYVNRRWVHAAIKRRVAAEFPDARWDDQHQFQTPTQSEFRARLYLNRTFDVARLEQVLQPTARARLVRRALAPEAEIWVVSSIYRIPTREFCLVLRYIQRAALSGIFLVVAHMLVLVGHK